jgi:hypothetical protein
LLQLISTLTRLYTCSSHHHNLDRDFTVTTKFPILNNESSRSLAMWFLQRIDDWMFYDPPDRITLSEDERAYVRLPAQALRWVARTLWTITTCSWTNILMPFTFTALILDSTSLSTSMTFWLNFVALLPVIGLFRYSSEVLSVEAPPLIRLLWNSTLGPFSPDVEVRQHRCDQMKHS